MDWLFRYQGCVKGGNQLICGSVLLHGLRLSVCPGGLLCAARFFGYALGRGLPRFGFIHRQCIGARRPSVLGGHFADHCVGAGLEIGIAVYHYLCFPVLGGGADGQLRHVAPDIDRISRHIRGKGRRKLARRHLERGQRRLAGIRGRRVYADSRGTGFRHINCLGIDVVDLIASHGNRRGSGLQGLEF